MNTPHLHLEIIAFAGGATIEMRRDGGPWQVVKRPSFNPRWEYRVYDPFRTLKAMHAEGAGIECRPKNQPEKPWKIVKFPTWTDEYEYRVAPRTEKVVGQVVFFPKGFGARHTFVQLTIDTRTGDILGVELLK